MKPIWVWVSLFVFLCGTAAAQNSRFDIFAGYCYLNIDNIDERYSGGKGFAADLSYKLGDKASANNIAIAGAFSANYEDGHNRYYYLFGPRIVHNTPRLTFFGQALAGGFTDADHGHSESHFALGLGGAIDIKATEVLAFRAFEFDYLPTHLSSHWSDNFRILAGVVFRIQ